MSRRKLKEHYKDNDNESPEGSFHGSRRTLAKNISTIQDPQQLYMAGAGKFLDEVDPIILADHPENIKLWLPSNLPSSSHEECCIPGLPYIEYRLRYAIATNALQDIRRFLRFSRAILTKTRSHISQTQKTRSNGQVDRVQRRIAQATATYRASWSAINRLAPNEEFGPWKDLLQELCQEDIRGPGREDSETSESHYLPSWIWRTPHQASASADEADLHAAIRVEWCQAQEQAARYEEEIELVVEEMRRTLVFFEFLTHEWERRTIFLLEGVDDTTNHGIGAYAFKQAAIYRKMVDMFVGDWYRCLKEKSLGLSWLEKYPTPSPATRQRLVSNVQLYHANSTPSDFEIQGDEVEVPILDYDHFE